MICSAPDCTTERGPLSKHCPYHSSIFKPLYLKYKEAEDRISGLLNAPPAKGRDIQSILKRYARVKEVYDLRCEFRQRAFKKEHWDQGHEFKIESILTKLVEYENH